MTIRIGTSVRVVNSDHPNWNGHVGIVSECANPDANTNANYPISVNFPPGSYNVPEQFQNDGPWETDWHFAERELEIVRYTPDEVLTAKNVVWTDNGGTEYFGKAVAYTDQPVYLIEREDGRRVMTVAAWVVPLPKTFPAVPEGMKPHVFGDSFTGMLCGALYADKNGEGEECGLSYEHPIHITEIP